MNTNHQQNPRKSSLKHLCGSEHTRLIIASTALLATAGAALALWPGKQDSPRETPPSLAQSNHNQAASLAQPQLNSTADGRTTRSPVRRPVSTQKKSSARDRGSLRYYLPNTSGVPKVYNVTDKQLAAGPSPVLPKEGSELNANQFAELMSGRIAFSPQDIPPSGKRVDDSTPLQVGQEVLLRWEQTWWAATVTGFEPDGAIQVSYFGWPRCWDEAVPRTDLQVDTNTREKAIQTVYSYSH